MSIIFNELHRNSLTYGGRWYGVRPSADVGPRRRWRVLLSVRSLSKVVRLIYFFLMENIIKRTYQGRVLAAPIRATRSCLGGVVSSPPWCSGHVYNYRSGGQRAHHHDHHVSDIWHCRSGRVSGTAFLGVFLLRIAFRANLARTAPSLPQETLWSFFNVHGVV